MNTNTLEDRLLNRELTRLQAELNRGMQIVNAVLQELPAATATEAKEEEQRWILEMFKNTLVYGSGGWKHNVTVPALQEFPPSMRERLLKQLVDTFLDEVEAMQEITANLE